MKILIHPTQIVFLLALAILSSVHADTPLESNMDKMKSAFRSLRADLQSPVDSDKNKYLALVEKLRVASVAAKDLDPQRTASIPQDNREDFLRQYRQEMDDLIALIDGLKKQISGSAWDAAREQIKLITQAQKDGHKEFRSEND